MSEEGVGYGGECAPPPGAGVLWEDGSDRADSRPAASVFPSPSAGVGADTGADTGCFGCFRVLENGDFVRENARYAP